MPRTALWRALRDALPARRQHEVSDALEGELTRLISEGRARFPTLKISQETFVGYLAVHLPEAGTLGKVLASVSGDLYLACCCALGDQRALELLETLELAKLEPVLVRRGVPQHLAEETVQRVRIKVILGKPRPKIAEYNGSSDLQRWLRAVAVREALVVRRQAHRGVRATRQLADSQWVAEGNVELELLKGKHKGDFETAFRAALDDLSARQRMVLRQRFLLGFGVEKIGGIYNIDPATASRWVNRAIDKLLAGTRRRLRVKLRLSRSELDSLIRLLRSQVDVSLATLLR